jgi:ribonuclease J
MEETSSFCNYGKHKYNTFRTGNRRKIDGVRVEPVHVDHSIPAAYGFIIHTSGGNIVYTGDLRRHGPRKDMTEDFVKKAGDCDPVALICEGTRMVQKEKRKNYSELQVKHLSNQIVSSTNKIVFITHYSRDMDRFRSFYDVATDNNRKIVISTKTAYLLSKLKSDERLDLPDPLKDNNIVVYYRRKRSGKFDERDYYVWERPFMDKMVTHEFVHKNQSKLVMDLDFYQFGELIDIRPSRGCHFIHSMSEPFSEEDIENDVMRNWLYHFGINFHQIHASGHMNKEQIASLIKEINPKKLFPIHTENPKLFKKISNKVQTPQYGKGYAI